MRWADFDMLGHVNNAVYLSYAENARGKYLGECIDWNWQADGIILASTTVDYKVPLLYTDKPVMHVRTTQLGNKSFEMEYLVCNHKEADPTEIARIRATLVMLDYETSRTYPIPDDIRQRFIDFEGAQLKN